MQATKTQITHDIKLDHSEAIDILNALATITGDEKQPRVFRDRCLNLHAGLESILRKGIETESRGIACGSR